MGVKKAPVVGAIIQARLGSSRLPGKVLLPLAGRPLLGHVIERLRRCRRLNKIIVATSTAPDDARLLEFAAAAGVDSFAGSENDVLQRFLDAAAAFKLDLVVRICSDSALIDWELIDKMIDAVIDQRADYAICDERVHHACEGYEVATVAALKKVARLTHEKSDHEHVTIYIRRHTKQFAVLYQPVPPLLRGEYRLSVDVAADLEFMERIYDELYRPGEPIDVRDAMRWLKRHPEVLAINAHVKQKPTTAAVTRHVLLLAAADSFAGRPGARLTELARNLAEHYHCVLTIAVPGGEPIAHLADRGYRFANLSKTGRPTKNEILAAVEKSSARVVLFDGRVLSPLALRTLKARDLALLPFEARPMTIYKEVLRRYKN
ncbi:MAG TPA: glycosyltransferase family protein [bacterium]|nr:glycosyltransferase family protein [bacterium]